MSDTANIKVQQDSPTATPLQSHLNDVNGAIAKMGGDPASIAPNEMADAVITAAMPFAAAAVAFVDGYGGANSNPAQVSRFLSPLHSKSSKNKPDFKPEPIPLTPVGKTARSTVQPGGKSIIAHERLAEMAKLAKTSLTGVIKGLKVTKDIVKQFSELIKEKTNTIRALEGINRYENNPNRVIADEKNGSQFLKDSRKQSKLAQKPRPSV